MITVNAKRFRDFVCPSLWNPGIHGPGLVVRGFLVEPRCPERDSKLSGTPSIAQGSLMEVILILGCEAL